MEQVIYGDILFIVNFSMDFLALYITSKLLKYSPGAFALTFGAGLGAAYGVLQLVITGNALFSNLISIGVAMLMCYIAFGAKTPIIYLRNILIFYAVSFLMGGTMTAIYSFLNSKLTKRNVIINGDINTLQGGISPLMFLGVAMLAIIFTYICSRVMESNVRNKTAKLEVSFNNKNVELCALCDSGNLLCEPLGGLPCAVCTYQSIKELLPKGTEPLFRDKNTSLLEFCDKQLARRVRIIPTSCVGTTGVLIGLIPDTVKVNGEEKAICIATDATFEGTDGCNAIMPTSVI